MPVIVEGAARVGDAAAVADRVLEPLAERRADADMRRHRQDAARELRKSGADRGIAAEHDLVRAHAERAIRGSGFDPLAHAVEIGGDHRALLVDAPAAALDVVGQRQREIERMQIQRIGLVQRLKIDVGPQRLAHPFGRPDHHVVVELFRQQIGLALDPVGVLVAPHVEPARRRIEPRRTFAQEIAHPLDPLARKRVERARVVDPHPLDQHRQLLRETGGAETAVAARGALRDAAGLQHHDIVAAAHQLARDPQSGQARADDADIGVGLEREARPRRVRHGGRGVKSFGGCFHGRGRRHARLYAARFRRGRGDLPNRE